jgi:hypothetical protein
MSLTRPPLKQILQTDLSRLQSIRPASLMRPALKRAPLMRQETHDVIIATRFRATATKSEGGRDGRLVVEGEV